MKILEIRAATPDELLLRVEAMHECALIPAFQVAAMLRVTQHKGDIKSLLLSAPEAAELRLDAKLKDPPPHQRVRCADCEWIGTSDQSLRAINPFDPDCAVAGCPKCKGFEFALLCDVDGCLSNASCGTPVEGGYRHTCSIHKPKAVHRPTCPNNPGVPRQFCTCVECKPV